MKISKKIIPIKFISKANIYSLFIISANITICVCAHVFSEIQNIWQNFYQQTMKTFDEMQ